MKVLKIGRKVCRKVYREDTIKVKCKHCDSILKIDLYDLALGFYLFVPKYYYECPVCKTWERVKLKEMPTKFKRRLTQDSM